MRRKQGKGRQAKKRTDMELTQKDERRVTESVVSALGERIEVRGWLELVKPLENSRWGGRKPKKRASGFPD